MKKQPRSHGGKRARAGRKSEGKAKFTVTMNAENVKKAKAMGPNFSGLMDRLLSDWLSHASAL